MHPFLKTPGFIGSTALHILLIVGLVVGMPSSKKTYDLPPPIPVQIIEADKVAALSTAPVVSSTPTKPEVKPQPAPAAAPPPPPKPVARPEPAPKPVAQPETPPPPQPTVKKPEPKPEPVKQAEKPKPQPEKPKVAAKTPEKPAEKPAEKPKATAKPAAAPAEDSLDDFASSILKSIPTQPASGGVQADQQGDELARSLNASEMDALRRQLARCWNFPAGASNPEELVVNVRVVMNRDRTVRSAQVLEDPAKRGNRFYQIASESALRAVRSPSCNPLALPPEKYQQWQTFTLRFDPRQMLGTN